MTAQLLETLMISSVVNLGDPLPGEELGLAARHARDCDLMLALGSSLVVNPAASLVGVALRSGRGWFSLTGGKRPTLRP